MKKMPGNTHKPRIICDSKEWNLDELKTKMQTAKEISKKNEGKELKKSNLSKPITTALKSLSVTLAFNSPKSQTGLAFDCWHALQKGPQQDLH
jgi:hypothetical protein